LLPGWETVSTGGGPLHWYTNAGPPFRWTHFQILGFFDRAVAVLNIFHTTVWEKITTVYIDNQRSCSIVSGHSRSALRCGEPAERGRGLSPGPFPFAVRCDAPSHELVSSGSETSFLSKKMGWHATFATFATFFGTFCHNIAENVVKARILTRLRDATLA
jgi:hypothetical protein